MALHLAEQLADAPEGFALFQAVGDGRVKDKTLLVALLEDFLHHRAQAVPRLRRQFDQHEPGMRSVERHAAHGIVFHHRLDARALHQFERGDAAR